MKNLINHIVSGITGSADFSVEESVEDTRVTYEIKADKNYIGKLIGKGGRTIQAIRNVVKIKAILEKKSIYVNISEKD
jgi:predicted RNA-binding protein YlqC (UPF0109 family)